MAALAGARWTAACRLGPARRRKSPEITPAAPGRGRGAGGARGERGGREGGDAPSPWGTASLGRRRQGGSESGGVAAVVTIGRRPLCSFTLFSLASRGAVRRPSAAVAAPVVMMGQRLLCQPWAAAPGPGRGGEGRGNDSDWDSEDWEGSRGREIEESARADARGLSPAPISGPMPTPRSGSGFWVWILDLRPELPGSTRTRARPRAPPQARARGRARTLRRPGLVQPPLL